MLERLEPRLLLAAGLDVVVIDSRLAAPDRLAGSVVEGAAVLLYDGAADSSAAVLARLVYLAESSDEGLASLSILSHGTGGQFRFGNSLVSAETLAARPRTWTELRSVLSDGANLYLFACNLLGDGGGGQILIDRLADLTGADVFASDDATGAGGDWVLEGASSGDEAELAAGVYTPLNIDLLATYGGTLATPDITARETVDNDADGQIDYVKVTTDENLDDDFGGLTMTVDGYALDAVTPYVTNIGGGGDNDNVFYVKLVEGGSADTGATPTVTVTANTSLSDFGGSDNMPVDDSAWWDTDWLNRQSVTFDNTNSAENLTDFPVLVSLDSGNIDFAKIEAGGADIRFVNGDGTALAYEIENWDDVGETATVWVKVPQIDSGVNTDFVWIYYNNPGASGSSGTAAWDSTGYAAVWHLNEDTGATSVDATSNTNDGAPEDGPTAATGKIAGALEFSASKARVEIPFDGSIDLTLYSNWTLSAWVKPTDYSGLDWPLIYSYGNYDASLGLTVKEGTDGLIEHWANDATLRQSSNTPATFNDWNHVVVVRNPATTTFYMNGTADGSGASVAINDDGEMSFIGGDGWASDDFLGLIDEVRVSTVARSADWLEAEYLSQNGTFAFNAFAGEESHGAGDTTATDTAAPVLLSASSPQSTGANLFQAVAQQLDLVFSESLSGAPAEADLEAALTFAAGATDGDNLPTIGTGANPISLATTSESNDTIRVTFNTDNTANSDLLLVGTHTVQVTTGTNITDTASITANTGATAVTIVGDTNDAPVLDNTGTMTLTDINEDDTDPAGDTVADIIDSATGDRITDVDSVPVEGIAVIGVDDTNGQWQYNTGSGWTAFGAVNNTNAVLLNTAASIRFVPNADYNGSAGDITFRAWDQTSGSNGDTGVDVSTNGGTTAFSTATETATLTVTAVNDAPDITGATFAVDEDAANGTDVGTPLVVTDPDAGDTTAWTITAGNGDGVFAIDAGTGQITVTDNTTLDFETTPQYVLTVRVTDSGALWDEAAVTVNVGDVNETPDIGDATFGVDEDAANGTDVGTPLAVTDPDAGDTTAWTITGGNGAGVFAIDADIGQITVTDNTTLDFETTPQYVLTVRVTDSGALWDEADVTVNVGDVNETPDIGDATFAVDEDAANGTDVGTPLAVTDPDAGDTTAWTITGGNGDGVFAIDADTGQITVTDNTTLDYETTPQYVLTVRVTDSGGLWDEADVTVDVNDINETPDIGDATFAVDEDAANGANVGAPLPVTDPDAGDTTAWTITGGNGDGVFAIDADTGQITVTDNTTLDYETTAQYVLTVRVTDSGSLWDEAAVTVNVGDVNETPDIGDATFAVDEDAANGTDVGTPLVVTDPDAGDTTAWTITAGNSGGVFAIDSGTGQITVADNTTLDYETTPQYVLTVRVTDSGALWDEAAVTVNVGDVNEAPDIGDATFAVDEDTANGTDVGTPLAVTDPDAGDTTAWTITAGNGDGVFAIDVDTGQITVTDNTTLDHETTPQYVLTVRVTDSGALWDEAAVTVNVGDVNETPDINDATFAVDEDAANGTDVGTPLVVTDPDAGDTTAWTITGGNGDGVFAIDADTGQITVTDNTTLDYETTPQYVLTVRVTDSGGLWDEAAVTVNVGDVNETPDIGDATFAVDEDAANGTDVGTPLAVTDPDAGDTTAWTITAGNGDGVFAIDADTGQITVTDNTTLDYETTAQYVLTVRVTDSGGLWDEADVTVDVGDVNETPTVNDQALPNVDENSVNGTVVGTVVASDPDAGDSLTYSITAGNTDNAFAINATTGEVTVNNQTALDFETNPTFTLTVEVEDTGTLTDTATVTVDLNDLNDAPAITSSATPSVAENTTTAVVTVTATDQDGDTPTFAITGGADQAFFLVNNVTGELTFSPARDFEIPSDADADNVYEVQVTADDGNGGTTVQDLSVTVTNVNETPSVPDYPSPAPPPVPIDPLPPPDIPVPLPPPSPPDDPSPVLPGGGGGSDGGSSDSGSEDTATDEAPADEADEGSTTPETEPEQPAEAPQTQQGNAESKPATTKADDGTATAKLDGKGQDTTWRPPEPEPVTESPQDEHDAPPAPSPFQKTAVALWQQLDATERQMDDQLSERVQTERITAGVVFGVSSALTAGFVIWCVKGSALLFSALSSLPLWRWIDPVPVLESWEQARRKRQGQDDGRPEDDEDERVERLFD